MPVGVVLMLIGASQVFAWTAYKLGALPMGLWQVLEHGGFNGALGGNFGAVIGRGLAWTVGFVIVSVVILGIVRRRAAHRLPMGGCRRARHDARDVMGAPGKRRPDA